MMKLKDFNQIIGLLFLASNLTAQISGTVLSSETNEPLVGVELLNATTNDLVISDNSGQFLFPNSEAQNQLIVIAEGYSILQEAVAGNSSAIELVLSPLSLEIEEVVIRNREEILFRVRRLKDVEGTKIFAGKKNEVVQVDNIVANKATNNARQIYAQVVGLNIYEDCSGGTQLNVGGRGLNPNRSANFNIRQNGYDISADVLGYPESYYTPPAEAIDEIQVIRGAASLQYGSQFGGLINFKLTEPSKKKIAVLTRQSLASYDTFTTFNQVSGTVHSTSYLAYVNYKNGNCYRPNSAYKSLTTHAQIRQKIGTKTTAGIEYTYLNTDAKQPGGLTDVQFEQNPSFSNRNRNYFGVNWNLFSANLEHDFHPDAKLKWMVNGLIANRDALGFRTNRVSQIDDINQPRDLIKGEFRNISSELTYLQNYKLKETPFTTMLGAKYYQANNTATQGPGKAGVEKNFNFQFESFPAYSNQSDFTFPNQNFAFFTESIVRVSPKFSVTPGTRFEWIKTESEGTYKQIDKNLAGQVIRENELEDNRVFKRNFLLGGIGLSFKPSTWQEFYGNISSNYRSVTFNDIRIVNPSFQIDPSIQDETGYTADIGFRGTLEDKLTYDIGAFLLNYDNRLGEILKEEERIDANGNPISTGRIIRYRGNIGEAQMRGIESFTEWNITNTFPLQNKQIYSSVFINAAFTNSEYLQSEQNNVKGNEVEFVPEKNIKTGLRFGYSNLLGSFQFTHIGEQFTDATNAPQNLQDNQRGIEGAIPAYSIADLSLSYKWRKFKLETGVNNLFDNQYFTRRATGYPGPGIIPSDPQNFYITLQGKF